jgi:RNA polymerase sigma-32 factor
MARTHVFLNAETLAVLDGPGAAARPVGPAVASASGGLDLYRGQVKRLRHLAPPEEERLLARMRRGDTAALDALALAHLGLVVEVVEARRRPGADPLDLVEMGNLALLSALKAYDPAVEPDFDAFARFSIRSAIGRAVCA